MDVLCLSIRMEFVLSASFLKQHRAGSNGNEVCCDRAHAGGGTTTQAMCEVSQRL